LRNGLIKKELVLIVEVIWDLILF